MQEQNELTQPNSNATDPTSLQPMDFTDILDGIFSLYRNRLRLFLTIVVVYVILQFGIEQISVSLAQRSSGLGIDTIILIFTSLCTSVLSVLVVAGLVYASAQVYLGREITAKTAWQQASRRFWPYLWGGILWGLAGGCLFVTIIGIPFAIYFWIRWSLYGLPVMFEETTGRNALRRSTELVKGSWWRVFGIILAISLIAGMIGFILQASSEFILSLIGLAAPKEPANLLEWLQRLYIPVPSEMGWFSYSVRRLVSLSIAFITMPISPIGSTLLYFDLRIRKEAYDLEMQVSD